MPTDDVELQIEVEPSLMEISFTASSTYMSAASQHLIFDNFVTC